MIKQIKCPPNPESNKGLNVLINTWLPAVQKYGLEYPGLIDTKKLAIGENKFIPASGTCNALSDFECVGKDRHFYLKGYPTESTEPTGRFGNQGIIGGIQEDIENLDFINISKAFLNTGPYASLTCKSSTLPVGNNLNRSDFKRNDFQDFILNDKIGWYDDTKCIPKNLYTKPIK